MQGVVAIGSVRLPSTRLLSFLPLRAMHLVLPKLISFSFLPTLFFLLPLAVASEQSSIIEVEFSNLGSVAYITVTPRLRHPGPTPSGLAHHEDIFIIYRCNLVDVVIQPVVDSFVHVVTRIISKVQAPRLDYDVVTRILHNSEYVNASASEPVRRQHEVLMTEKTRHRYSILPSQSRYRKCTKK